MAPTAAPAFAAESRSSIDAAPQQCADPLTLPSSVTAPDTSAIAESGVVMNTRSQASATCCALASGYASVDQARRTSRRWRKSDSQLPSTRQPAALNANASPLPRTPAPTKPMADVLRPDHSSTPKPPVSRQPRADRMASRTASAVTCVAAVTMAIRLAAHGIPPGGQAKHRIAVAGRVTRPDRQRQPIVAGGRYEIGLHLVQLASVATTPMVVFVKADDRAGVSPVNITSTGSAIEPSAARGPAISPPSR